MWIRKSEEEIQEYLNTEEAKRKSLLRPFLFALVLTMFMVVIHWAGYRGGRWKAGLVLTTNTTGVGLQTFLVGLLFFGFIFGVSVYWQRQGFFTSSDQLLCRECKQPANANPSLRCRCGGTLEPFAFYNWQEDEQASKLS